MLLRTFIALEIPEIHKKAINSHLDTWRKVYQKGINWVNRENLHLTLLFIGDTQSGEVQEIGKALFMLLNRTRHFNMESLGFELFPAGEPRLLWVKLRSEDDGIYALGKDLGKMVKQFACQPDIKPLKLHITVGRIKTRLPVWLEQEFMKAELTKEKAEYTDITFYHSMLKSSGPVYTPIQHYKLR